MTLLFLGLEPVYINRPWVQNQSFKENVQIKIFKEIVSTETKLFWQDKIVPDQSENKMVLVEQSDQGLFCLISST